MREIVLVLCLFSSLSLVSQEKMLASWPIESMIDSVKVTLSDIENLQTPELLEPYTGRNPLYLISHAYTVDTIVGEYKHSLIIRDRCMIVNEIRHHLDLLISNTNIIIDNISAIDRPPSITQLGYNTQLYICQGDDENLCEAYSWPFQVEYLRQLSNDFKKTYEGYNYEYDTDNDIQLDSFFEIIDGGLNIKKTLLQYRILNNDKWKAELPNINYQPLEIEEEIELYLISNSTSIVSSLLDFRIFLEDLKSKLTNRLNSIPEDNKIKLIEIRKKGINKIKESQNQVVRNVEKIDSINGVIAMAREKFKKASDNYVNLSKQIEMDKKKIDDNISLMGKLSDSLLNLDNQLKTLQFDGLRLRNERAEFLKNCSGSDDDLDCGNSTSEVIALTKQIMDNQRKIDENFGYKESVIMSKDSLSDANFQMRELILQNEIKQIELEPEIKSRSDEYLLTKKENVMKLTELTSKKNFYNKQLAYRKIYFDITITRKEAEDSFNKFFDEILDNGAIAPILPGIDPYINPTKENEFIFSEMVKLRENE